MHGYINTTPKEPKTERDCSHRQLFRPLWGLSVWRNNQRSGSDDKIFAHSDFSPDLELLTPTESRYTTCLLGGKSPSVKLMSRRENKELAKTNQEKMDKTMKKMTAYRISKRSTVQKFIKYNINHKGLHRTANEYPKERRIYKDLISKNNNVDI